LFAESFHRHRLAQPVGQAIEKRHAADLPAASRRISGTVHLARNHDFLTNGAENGGSDHRISSVPLEYRQIVFAPTEVLLAIREHRKRLRNPLPPGSITRFEIGGEPTVGTELEITDDKTGDRQVIRIEGEALAAALILYCIDHKIPMPVDATKRIVPSEKGLALSISGVNAARSRKQARS
jgi:hypothetical protein